MTVDQGSVSRPVQRVYFGLFWISKVTI